MAPAFRQEELCVTFYNNSASFNNHPSSNDTEAYTSDKDKHALLYIVCTLLFYSLGIMVGIVSYIKREKQDIQQDRMFDDFLNSFSDQTEAKHYRQLKVQETIERLAEIDRKNKVEQNGSNTVKHTSDAKTKGNTRRFYKFVTLNVMQSPVSMKNKSSEIKAESNNSKRVEISEVSKEQNNDFLDKQNSEVIQNEYHLNGEAGNTEAPTNFNNEDV